MWIKKAVYSWCALIFALLTAAELGFGQTGRPPVARGRKPAGTAPKSASDEPLANFQGALRGIEKSVLTLEDPEGHLVQFYCSKKTSFYNGSKKIKRSGLKAGDPLSVEARRGLDGALEAVHVRLESQKKP